MVNYKHLLDFFDFGGKCSNGFQCVLIGVAVLGFAVSHFTFFVKFGGKY